MPDARITPEIGELHHLIALIVMSQDHQARPQRRFRDGNALVKFLFRKPHVQFRQGI